MTDSSRRAARIEARDLAVLLIAALLIALHTAMMRAKLTGDAEMLVSVATLRDPAQFVIVAMK